MAVYIQEPLVGGKQTKHILSHGFIAFLWQCMSAIKTYPLLNACTHLATIGYGRAQSPDASHSSAWHLYAFLLWNCYFHVQMLSHFMDFQFRTISPAHWCFYAEYVCTAVCVPPSNGNIYKYIPCAFQHVCSISYVATFLAKKKNSCHDLRMMLIF
jgi:hypothetical protein